MINLDNVLFCTDLKQLKQYAMSSDLGTVVALAKNRNTPPDLLDMLTKHYSVVVKHEVAKHTNTSIETLKKLSKDKDMLVRDYALRNLERREA